jgi:hypothetical protein
MKKDIVEEFKRAKWEWSESDVCEIGGWAPNQPNFLAVDDRSSLSPMWKRHPKLLQRVFSEFLKLT